MSRMVTSTPLLGQVLTEQRCAQGARRLPPIRDEAGQVVEGGRVEEVLFVLMELVHGPDNGVQGKNGLRTLNGSG